MQKSHVLALAFALLCAGSVSAQKPLPAQSNLGQSAKEALLNKGSASQGRFRAILTGFTCNRESADDILERDGRRDEIFFLSRTVGLVQSGGQWRTVSQSTPLRSLVYGDPTGRTGRVQVGSGMPGLLGGEPGGIMTGNSFPTVPYQRRGEPTPTKLPLLLWQGELSMVLGAPKLILMPTVWEWDGPDDLLTMLGRPFISAPILSFPDRLLGALTQNFTGGAAAGGSEVELLSRIVQPVNAEWALGREIRVGKSFLGDAKDRPIGMKDASNAEYSFRPFGVVLTYDTADWMSKTDFGNGRGIITVRYVDAEALKGDYTLFVQIERQ